jgi:HTH-type transcriptional regulator/antitoxin HigA
MPERCDVKIFPIKTETDYDAALARAWKLMDAKADTPEADELEVLSTLIEAYEDRHFPMDLPDPIEAIKFRMEQQGLTRKDLEPIIGTRTRIAEVLNKRRNLSIAMIRRLHEKLGIPAEVLIQSPRPSREGAGRRRKHSRT